MLLILTPEQYNQEVGKWYAYDWALSNKTNGVYVIQDTFDYGAWGRTIKTASRKVNKHFRNKLDFKEQQQLYDFLNN